MRKQGHGTSASQTDGSTGPESRVGATLLSGGRGPPTATTPSDPAGHDGTAGLSRPRADRWLFPQHLRALVEQVPGWRHHRTVAAGDPAGFHQSDWGHQGAARTRGGLKKSGRWRTAGQVAAWLQEAHGIKRAAKSIYRWLGKANGALRVPRPAHVLQNPPASAAFRAELEQRLAKLALPKAKPVKIWVADESRFGLHTQSRRCWALRGQRVVIPQPQRYEWEYVYGALEVLEGDAEFRFMPSVSLDFSRDFLQQIAASDPAAEHVVIWDQAGFHQRADEAGLPERIHLLPLPPYSPELNPIEGLWDQVQDVTCNQRHASLDDLEETLTAALRPFWETPAKVLSLMHHWLHAQANATP